MSPFVELLAPARLAAFCLSACWRLMSSGFAGCRAGHARNGGFSPKGLLLQSFALKRESPGRRV